MAGNARRLLGYSAVSWINAAVGFILIPISAWLFAPDELGKINMLISAAAIVYAICLLGYDQGLLRFFYECKTADEKGELFRTCIGISLVVFCIVGAISLFLFDPISRAICESSDMATVLVLLLIVVSHVMLRYAQVYWRAAERFARYAVISFALTFLMKFCFIFAGINTFTYESALAALAFFAISFFVLALLMNARQLFSDKRILEWPQMKALGCYALPLAPAAILSFANSYIPLYAVRACSSFEDVGIFSMAVTLSAVVSVLASGVNTFWSPYVFKNYRTHQSTIQRFHQLLVLALSVFVLLVIVGEDVVLGILGPKYITASAYFPFLLIVPLAYTVSETSGIGINISKKSKFLILFYAITVISNIALCFVLVQSIGLWGAALASSICAVLMLAMKTYVGEREYKSVSSVRFMVISFAVVFAVALANAIFGLSAIQRLIASVFGVLIILIVYGKRDLGDAISLGAQGVRSIFEKPSN